MRLNALEKMLLNNPARRMVQEFYEAPLLLRMAGRLDGKRAIEIGCGQGFGMEIILRQFGAARVFGIDLDPEMIARAQRRILPYAGRADVSVGNATAIPAADESFDAVFDFGVVHHFEEVSKQALDRWLYRALFEHPKENRFTAENFVAALESHGIAVSDRLVSFFFGDLFAGVGHRAS